MNNRERFAAIVIAASLSACADLARTDGFIAAEDDPPPKCIVKVRVDDGFDMSIDHEPLRTKGCTPNAQGQIVVTWKLNPARKYKFDTASGRPGIEFPGAKNPSHPRKPECGATSGIEYKCTFNGRSKYKWSYNVNLVRLDFPNIDLDPTMVND